ncbi:MAG: hypothetical protein QXJ02_07280, partial [Candidatus Bathyarchaeia archaeon]
MRVRTVKTASGNTAIQVVSYQGKKAKILKHIGTAKTEGEIKLLKQLAQEWITQSSGQRNLFEEEKNKDIDVVLNKYKYLGIRYGFIYNIINKIFKVFKLNNLNHQRARMFLDFVL